MELKKYLLEDKELKYDNKSDIPKYDGFDNEKIANIIIDIIEEKEAPFNIGLIGSWGIGKTSILNMVDKKLNKKSYEMFTINAWKYENESIREVFLTEAINRLDPKNVKPTYELAEERYKKLYTELDGCEIKSLNFLDYIRKLGSTVKNELLIYSIIAIVTFGLYYIYKSIMNDLGDVWTGYIRNIYKLVLIPIMVVIFEKLTSSIKKNSIGYNFTIKTIDYEIILKEVLSLDKHRDKKIIVVLDDLDRLNKEKMIEALNSIKTFMEMEKFIFIVPYDDEKLRNALNPQDDELIIEKLFQYRVTIPPNIFINLEEYIKKLTMKYIPDVINYCGGKDKFEELLMILIHKNVKTIRQAKKIINQFTINLKLLDSRKSELSDNILNENGLKVLAKISVLQSDYNDFYNILFIRNAYFNDFLNYLNGDFKDVPYDLEKFIEEDEELILNETDKGCHIKNEYKELADFLTYTQDIEEQFVAPYIYLNQDKFSSKISDEVTSNITSSLRSLNYASIIDLINEKVSITDIIGLISYILKQEKNKYNLRNSIITSINILSKIVLDDNLLKLVKDIDEVNDNSMISELQKYSSKFLWKGLVIYATNSNNNYASELMSNYLDMNFKDVKLENIVRLYELFNSNIISKENKLKIFDSIEIHLKDHILNNLVAYESLDNEFILKLTNLINHFYDKLTDIDKNKVLDFIISKINENKTELVKDTIEILKNFNDYYNDKVKTILLNIMDLELDETQIKIIIKLFTNVFNYYENEDVNGEINDIIKKYQEFLINKFEFKEIADIVFFEFYNRFEGKQINLDNFTSSIISANFNSNNYKKQIGELIYCNKSQLASIRILDLDNSKIPIDILAKSINTLSIEKKSEIISVLYEIQKIEIVEKRIYGIGYLLIKLNHMKLLKDMTFNNLAMFILMLKDEKNIPNYMLDKLIIQFFEVQKIEYKNEILNIFKNNRKLDYFKNNIPVEINLSDNDTEVIRVFIPKFKIKAKLA